MYCDLKEQKNVTIIIISTFQNYQFSNAYLFEWKLVKQHATHWNTSHSFEKRNKNVIICKQFLHLNYYTKYFFKNTTQKKKKKTEE